MSNTNKTQQWYKTEVGSQVTSKKYFHEGEDFDAFTDRVSGIFQDKALAAKVKQGLYSASFFPAGRSLYSAGSKGKFKASMSNCYILPSPEDSTDSINSTIANMDNIFKFGGGVGINISNLRPRGAKVMNSAKTSTGAVSFMPKFDVSASVIGSNNRRAALIIGLNCDHPDIEEFLEVKRNNTAIQSANISILFTDEFMEAVEAKADYELKFTVEATGEVIAKTINAYELFWKFCEAQHNWAEPGALFIDTVRRNNLMSGYPLDQYRIDCSNPCAEYVGSAYNACNLASINLYNIVEAPFTSDAKINYEYFTELIETGVRALDEILDYGLDMQPLPENRQAVTDYRAIGLGIFGLADMLIALGIRYGSPESLKVIDEIMDHMQVTAITESAMLSKEKGSFAKYDYELIAKSRMFQGLPYELKDLIKEHGLRNNSVLSIAPTGSLATMAGISSGVEPLYQVSYERTTHALEKEGKFFKVFAKSVEHLLKYEGFNDKNIAAFDNAKIKEMFPFVVDAYDVTPSERIAVQATMQKYVDNAISSTLNMKESSTVQDVFDAYLQAWCSGCKGLTIFRENCERIAILSKPKEIAEQPKLNHITPVKRRSVGKTSGNTMVKHTACSPNIYVTVNTQDDNVFEVFTNSSQGCQSNINTITRMASLALRSGVKVEEVVKELRSNTCSACTVVKSKGNKGVSVSCGAAIAEAIEETYLDTQPVEYITEDCTEFLPCPECGELTMLSSAKCPTCSSCGFSKCD